MTLYSHLSQSQRHCFPLPSLMFAPLTYWKVPDHDSPSILEPNEQHRHGTMNEKVCFSWEYYIMVCYNIPQITIQSTFQTTVYGDIECSIRNS